MTKGQRIRLMRENINMSQTELAKKAGISKQTLYKYENDIVSNIPSDKLEKISDILNTSPAYIMGWHEKIEDEPVDSYYRSLAYASTLTDDEIFMIETYRDYSERTKELLKAYMDILSDSTKRR